MGRTRRKNTSPHSLAFDAAQVLQFPAATVGANQANSVIAARLVLPCPVKIYRMTAVAYGGSVTGAIAANVVLGAGAEGVVGTPETASSLLTGDPSVFAVPGNVLFAADQALTVTQEAVSSFNVLSPLFDVIWPTGDLTLRFTSGAGAAANVIVGLLVKPIDIFRQRPNASGGGIEMVFNPAIDIG